MPQERYTWAAHYDDGSVHPEIDAAGRSRGFTTVDAGRCIALELTPTDGTAPRVLVDVRPGERPVFFRRRTYRLELGSGQSRHEQTLTVAGTEGETGSRYVFITEDGTVVLTSTREPV